MSQLPVPVLDLDSLLVQRTVDAASGVSIVWELWAASEVAPAFRALKDEVEARATDLLREHGRSTLRDLTARYASHGRTVNPPASWMLVRRRDVARFGAFLLLDRACDAAAARLAVSALHPPQATDRAYQAEPGFFDNSDERHRLVTLAPEMVSAPRRGNNPWLVYGDHAFYPHPLLRGARELLCNLWWLAKDGRYKVQVAIDPHRVTDAAKAYDIGMYDYWYGARFDADKIDDPKTNGLTRHSRTRAGRVDDYPLLTTDFIWAREGPTDKSLRVCERVPRDTCWSSSMGWVWNRYAHAMRNTSERRFYHLDGALRAYRQDAYPTAAETPTAELGEAVYRKMWRIDGENLDAEWGSLIARWFRGNEHIFEYFGGAVDDRPFAAAA